MKKNPFNSFNHDIHFRTAVMFLLALALAGASQAQVVRVDDDAPNAYPQNNPPGATWGDAFRSLQDAIHWVQTQSPGQSNQFQIWVAAGTYKPTEFATAPAQCLDNLGNPVGYRCYTFDLHEFVSLYGGFAGNEPPPEQGGFNMRNPAANPTTLSGEIGDPQTMDDNSYHVVRAIDATISSVIDGFTIRDGNALGDFTNYGPCTPAQIGGGMLVICNPGGMLIQAHEPTVLRCTFTNNQAVYGAGAFVREFTPNEALFWNCRFTGNRAGKPEPDPVAGFGAAMTLWRAIDVCAGFGDPTGGGRATILNCLIDNNWAHNGPGAIWCTTSTSTEFVNCTIVDNQAGVVPGGIFHQNSNSCPGNSMQVFLRNTILWGNHCDNGACQQFGEVNQILGARASSYSVIQDLNALSCDSNTFALDPQFVDPTIHNYRLKPISPCVNRGNPVLNTIAPDDFDLDQDNDTTELDPDFGLSARVTCSVPDIGCYEFQPTDCSADINFDGSVSVPDLLAVITGWGACPTWPTACAADIDPACGNGQVNVNDLLAVINAWGACELGGTFNGPSLTSVQDCMEAATNEGLTPYSQEWNNFVNKCVEGLCEAHIINCD